VTLCHTIVTQKPKKRGGFIMCIVNGKGVKIAEKDIVVIKVLLKSGSSIFRDEEGKDCGYFWAGQYITDFNDMIRKKAIGFNEGFGFTVFKLGADVKYYTDKIFILERLPKINFFPEIIMKKVY